MSLMVNLSLNLRLVMIVSSSDLVYKLIQIKDEKAIVK